MRESAPVLVTSCCCDKISDKKKLFTLAQSCQVQLVHQEGEGMARGEAQMEKQAWRSILHLLSGTQEMENSGALLSFSFVFTLGPQTMEWFYLHSWWAVPLHEKHLHTDSQRPIS